MGTAQTVFVGNAKEALAAEIQAKQIEPGGGTASEAPSEPTAEARLAPPAMAPGSHGPPASTGAAPEGMTPAEAPSTGGQAKLVMLGADGQPIGERILAAGESLEVGRSVGAPWEDDAYLDPTHAKLTPVEDGVMVDDFDSLNGIFVKVTDRMDVQHGDQFRVGQELIRYEDLPEPTPTTDGTERMGSPNPGYWGRVFVLVDPERASAAYPIEGEGLTIGRETGDITFPQDGYVSGRHCRIVGDDDGIYVEDVGSSNGTYMRARNGQTIPYGSLVLVGQKLFQIERS